MRTDTKTFHPYTKFILSLAVSLLAVIFDQTQSLLFLWLLSSGLLFLSRPPKSLLLPYLFISLTTVWGLVISQGFFYQDFPRTVLFCLLPPGEHFSGLCLVREGLRYGLIQSLRLLSALSVGFYVVVSTPKEDFFRALSALPLPRGLTFMTAAAVRFLPSVSQQWRLVRQALRLRGYRPFSRGFFHTLRTEFSVVYPLLFSSVRTARTLADTLLTRGFDPLSRSKTGFLPTWPLKEKIFSSLIVLIALAFLILKILFWLYLQEVYYAEALRGLYHLARVYL